MLIPILFCYAGNRGYNIIEELHTVGYMASIRERVRGMSVVWFSFNLAASAIALASHALGGAAGIDELH